MRNTHSDDEMKSCNHNCVGGIQVLTTKTVIISDNKDFLIKIVIEWKNLHPRVFDILYRNAGREITEKVINTEASSLATLRSSCQTMLSDSSSSEWEITIFNGLTFDIKNVGSKEQVMKVLDSVLKKLSFHSQELYNKPKSRSICSII